MYFDLSSGHASTPTTAYYFVTKLKEKKKKPQIYAKMSWTMDVKSHCHETCKKKKNKKKKSKRMFEKKSV